MARELPLTRKDFVSDQQVRWCPGCGDYAILAAIQKTMPELEIPRERMVFVSGIGCSSRFPYYMNTYGFHSIHGRAPAIATGVKCARPDLTVWVVTGDGDGLSIGGNHLLHACRRNLDLNVLLFNNRIYGLTKGQTSPTSELGKVTKSTPFGSIDRPINPLRFAISSEATFVARTYDADPKHMGQVFRAAASHHGLAFVEILQNCVIFNDGAFKEHTDRKRRADTVLALEAGQPAVFGEDRTKGLRCTGGQGFEVVTWDKGGPVPDDVYVHDPARALYSSAYMLTEVEDPLVVGIFRQVDAPIFDRRLQERADRARERGAPDLAVLFREGAATWQVS